MHFEKKKKSKIRANIEIPEQKVKSFCSLYILYYEVNKVFLFEKEVLCHNVANK